MPSVIRPMTNPGRTSKQSHARSVQCVGQPAAEPVESRLGRAVDVVGTPHPDAGDGREHDDATRPGGAHRGGQHRQQTGLCDEIRVHDGRGMCRILLGAGLVAENAEGQHRGADRAVSRRRWSRRGRLCDSSASASNSRTATAAAPAARHRGDLLVEVIGAAGGQHHRRARRQPRRQLEPDLAASTEDHDAAGIRVLHGSDYRLR